MIINKSLFDCISSDVQQDILDKNIYDMSTRIFDDLYFRINHYNNITKNIYN